jgi:hypothetical protein
VDVNDRIHCSSVSYEHCGLRRTGVIHQDINSSKIIDSGLDGLYRLVLDFDTPLNGHGTTPHLFNHSNHFIGCGMITGVVYDNIGALFRIGKTNGSSHTSSAAGYYRYLTF